MPNVLPEKGTIFTFDNHYGRQSISEYAGWWRSFSFSGELAHQYRADRVIHVESDAFILTKKLARWLSTTQDGWRALYNPRWKFPESQVQAIAGKCLQKLRAYYTKGEAWWCHPRGRREYAEFLLPFTKVEKRFKGDRYTDYEGAPPSQFPPTADFVAQAHLKMKFKPKLR